MYFPCGDIGRIQNQNSCLGQIFDATVRAPKKLCILVGLIVQSLQGSCRESGDISRSPSNLVEESLNGDCLGPIEARCGNRGLLLDAICIRTLPIGDHEAIIERLRAAGATNRPDTLALSVVFFDRYAVVP